MQVGVVTLEEGEQICAWDPWANVVVSNEAGEDWIAEEHYKAACHKTLSMEEEVMWVLLVVCLKVVAVAGDRNARVMANDACWYLLQRFAQQP